MLKEEDRIFKNLYNDLGWDIESSIQRGDWSQTKDIISKGRDQIIKEIKDSELRGRGGAGFPTGRKWGIVRSFPGPRLMAVNADEGEPGTFKDRHYLERDPHRFLSLIHI